MKPFLYLSLKQLHFITVLMVCLIERTKQQNQIDEDFSEKTDKSLFKCVDSLCKCDLKCVDEYKQEVSLYCHSIDNYKEIEAIIALIKNTNKTFCGKSVSKLMLNGVHIRKSDSLSVIESIKLFNKRIEMFNISSTLLAEMPNQLFSSFINLKHLILSHNNLTNFDSNALLSPNNSLISLDLSYNQLNSVNLTNLNALEMLSLSNNQLNTIKEFDIFKANHKLNSISIENNEWNCDNKLIWLLKYIINSSNRDQVRCSHPEIAKGMTFAQRLSVLQTRTCSQCECSLSRNKDTMSVNCSDKQLNSLPSRLPSITKIVRLENNNIRNISLNAIALNDWRNVSYLHLNNNTIESLVGLEGTKLLKNLVALHMASNRLREIPVYILDQLSHLDELYLSENPWHCDCKTVVFQNWLQQHFKIVKDVYNIRCAAYNTANNKPKNGLHYEYISHKFSNKILLRIPKSELCPQPNEPIEIFEIINWLLASLILIIIMKLIYDYFWQKRTGKLPLFFKLNLN